jgi:hypothetical protein
MIEAIIRQYMLPPSTMQKRSPVRLSELQSTKVNHKDQARPSPMREMTYGARKFENAKKMYTRLKLPCQ